MTDNAYLKTIDRLEPEICPIDTPAALASIAISLRRIADLLEEEKLHKQQAAAARKDRGERMVNLAT